MNTTIMKAYVVVFIHSINTTVVVTTNTEFMTFIVRSVVIGGVES